MPRPAVSAEPIDSILRSKLEKLERILLEDCEMPAVRVIRIMGFVFENFVESPGVRIKPASPVYSANSGKSISREAIMR